jgi:hypothetical protein
MPSGTIPLDYLRQQIAVGERQLKIYKSPVRDAVRDEISFLPDNNDSL